LEQAERWAELTAERRGTGTPTVSVYEFDETMLDKLKILKFEKANKKWLDFVVANRDNTVENHKWDMVIGPVANDRTMPVIRLFIAKVYTSTETLRRLLPQKLHNQYTFKTVTALQFLKFQGVIEK
jgi:hypothetical protein